MISTLPADTDTQSAGFVCAANESRFNAAHYSEPLTAFTVGWRDRESLADLLEFLAPSVPVGRRFEFKKAINAEAFSSETDDIRAIGADFKRMEYGGETVNERTLNKGLTVRVDHDEEQADNWQERYVQLLLHRLYRNELRRAIAALDGVATNVDKVWNGSSNPDGDIRQSIGLGADAAGVRPNRVAFGEGAWDMRVSAYEGQENAAAYRAAGMTPEETAKKLLTDGARIVGARYQSGSSKANVLGDTVYIFSTRDGLMKDEPSNIKRFVTPADGGSHYRVYVDDRGKYTDITVEHYSNIVITSTLGVRKLSVAEA